VDESITQRREKKNLSSYADSSENDSKLSISLSSGEKASSALQLKTSAAKKIERREKRLARAAALHALAHCLRRTPAQPYRKTIKNGHGWWPLRSEGAAENIDKQTANEEQRWRTARKENRRKKKKRRQVNERYKAVRGGQGEYGAAAAKKQYQSANFSRRKHIDPYLKRNRLCGRRRRRSI